MRTIGIPFTQIFQLAFLNQQNFSFRLKGHFTDSPRVQSTITIPYSYGSRLAVDSILEEVFQESPL
jgi:hypothetical protein